MHRDCGLAACMCECSAESRALQVLQVEIEAPSGSLEPAEETRHAEHAEHSGHADTSEAAATAEYLEYVPAASIEHAGK